MPDKTNQERIIDNNDKIDEIKSKVSDLPDYQDIQPVYGNKLYNCELVNKSTTVGAVAFDSEFEPELGLTIANNKVNFYKLSKDTEGDYSIVTLLNSFNFTECPIEPATDGSSINIHTMGLTSPNISNPYIIVVTSNSSSGTVYSKVNIIPYAYSNGEVTVDATGAMTYRWGYSNMSSWSSDYPVVISDDGKHFRYGSPMRDYYSSYMYSIGTVNWETHKVTTTQVSASWYKCEAYFVNNNTLIEYYLNAEGSSKPNFKCMITLRILKDAGTTWMSKTFDNGAIAVTSDLKYVLYKNSSTVGTNVFHLNTINIDYENNTITETLYKTFTLPDTDNNILINMDFSSTGCPIITLGDNILAVCGGVISGDSNKYVETYKLDFTLDVPLIYDTKYIVGTYNTRNSISYST